MPKGLGVAAAVLAAAGVPKGFGVAAVVVAAGVPNGLGVAAAVLAAAGAKGLAAAAGAASAAVGRPFLNGPTFASPYLSHTHTHTHTHTHKPRVSETIASLCGCLIGKRTWPLGRSTPRNLASPRWLPPDGTHATRGYTHTQTHTHTHVEPALGRHAARTQATRNAPCQPWRARWRA